MLVLIFRVLCKFEMTYYLLSYDWFRVFITYCLVFPLSVNSMSQQFFFSATNFLRFFFSPLLISHFEQVHSSDLIIALSERGFKYDVQFQSTLILIGTFIVHIVRDVQARFQLNNAQFSCVESMISPSFVYLKKKSINRKKPTSKRHKIV